MNIKKREQEILLQQAAANKKFQQNEHLKTEIKNKNEAVQYYNQTSAARQRGIEELMTKYNHTFLSISASDLIQIIKHVEFKETTEQPSQQKNKQIPIPPLNLDEDQSEDEEISVKPKIKPSTLTPVLNTPKNILPKGSRGSILEGSMLRAARRNKKLAKSEDTDEKLSIETCNRLEHMLSMIDDSDEFSEFYDHLSNYLGVTRDGKRNIPDKDISFFAFSGETLNQFLDYLEKFHRYAITNFQPLEYRFITVLAKFVEKGVLKNCIDTLKFDSITYMDMLLSIFTVLDKNIVKVKSRKDAFETLKKIEGEDAMHLGARILNSYQYAFPGAIIEHDKRAIAKVMEFLDKDLGRKLENELAVHNSYTGTQNTFSQTIRVLSALSKFDPSEQVVYTSTMNAATNALVSPKRKTTSQSSRGTSSPSPGAKQRAKSPIDVGLVWDEEGLINGTGFTCPICQRLNIGLKICISCDQRCYGCYKKGHFLKRCYKLHPKVNTMSNPFNQITTPNPTNFDALTNLTSNTGNTANNKKRIAIEVPKKIIYNSFKQLSPNRNRLLTRSPINNIKLTPTKGCFNQKNIITSPKKVAFDTRLSIVCGFDSRDNAASLSNKASEKILPLKFNFNKSTNKSISEKGERTKIRPINLKLVSKQTNNETTVPKPELFLNTLFNNLNREIRDEYINLSESEIADINDLNNITEINSKHNQTDNYINPSIEKNKEDIILSTSIEDETNEPISEEQTSPIEILFTGPMISITDSQDDSFIAIQDAFQYLYDYVDKVTFKFEPTGAVYNHFYSVFNKIKDIKCNCLLTPTFNHKNVILTNFLNINKIYKNFNFVFSSNYPDIQCKDEFFQIFYLLLEACKQYQHVKNEENSSFRNKSVSDKYLPPGEKFPVKEEVLRPCTMVKAGDGSTCDHSGTTCAIANDLYTQKNPQDPAKLEYLRLLNGLYCAKNWLIDGLTEEIDSKWRPNIFRTYININGHCITALVDSGSNISMLTSKAVELFNIPTTPLTEDKYYSEGVAGRINITHMCEVAVTIHDLQFSPMGFKVIETSHPDHHVTLGSDFFEKNNLILDSFNLSIGRQISKTSMWEVHTNVVSQVCRRRLINIPIYLNDDISLHSGTKKLTNFNIDLPDVKIVQHFKCGCMGEINEKLNNSVIFSGTKINYESDLPMEDSNNLKCPFNYEIKDIVISDTLTYIDNPLIFISTPKFLDEAKLLKGKYIGNITTPMCKEFDKRLPARLNNTLGISDINEIEYDNEEILNFFSPVLEGKSKESGQMRQNKINSIENIDLLYSYLSQKDNKQETIRYDLQPPEEGDIENKEDDMDLPDIDSWTPEVFFEQLNVSLKNETEKEKIEKLLYNYKEVFSKGEFSEVSDLPKMVVELTSQVPIYLPRFRFSPEIENIIQEQVDELLAQNLIKPSTSPYNFPVLPVKKRVPEGQPPKYRLCLDLRALNKIAVKYNYPLPDINVTLQQMGGFAHYVKLDLANGFWQLGLDPTSEDYLSFSTAKG
ncbi:unnamed protein product, partial [Rotaria magnacalcarata]